MPELIRGVSYDEYVAMPGVRFNGLKGFRRSPLHARHEMLKPMDDTDSTVLGTALHTMILEPTEFLHRYFVAPKLDKRTPEGKAEWMYHEAQHPNQITLTDPEANAVRCMAKAIHEHPFIESVVDQRSLRELVATWDERVDDYEVACKARIDWIVLLGDVYVIDLKTVRDASDFAFSKQIHTYGYHAQAASYLRGLQVVKPAQHERRWLWVTVENTEPYGCKIHEAGEGLLVQGEREWRSWLRDYAVATKSGHWTGYDTNILPIDLPRYAQRDREVN